MLLWFFSVGGFLVCVLRCFFGLGLFFVCTMLWVAWLWLALMLVVGVGYVGVGVCGRIPTELF
jgi:hypothetical protein